MFDHPLRLVFQGVGGTVSDEANTLSITVNPLMDRSDLQDALLASTQWPKGIDHVSLSHAIYNVLGSLDSYPFAKFGRTELPKDWYVSPSPDNPDQWLVISPEMKVVFSCPQKSVAICRAWDSLPKNDSQVVPMYAFFSIELPMPDASLSPHLSLCRTVAGFLLEDDDGAPLPEHFDTEIEAAAHAWRQVQHEHESHKLNFPPIQLNLANPASDGTILYSFGQVDVDPYFQGVKLSIHHQAQELAIEFLGHLLKVLADVKSSGVQIINLTSKIENLESALSASEEQRVYFLNQLRALNYGDPKDAWHWVGDGSDHLENLMAPVLIPASDLREIIDQRDCLSAYVQTMVEAAMSDGLGPRLKILLDVDSGPVMTPQKSYDKMTADSLRREADRLNSMANDIEERAD